MDLHAIASPAIAAVNPMTTAQLYKSTGSNTTPSGKPEPAYAPPITGDVQAQSLSGSQLQLMNSMGINGILVKVYLFGDWESVVRQQLTGGDKFVFSYAGFTNATWLVVQVLERWPDWCAVAVQMQVTP